MPTVMEGVLVPVLQAMLVKLPFSCKLAEPPGQIPLGPLMVGLGKGLAVVVTAAWEVQPVASVAVTV